MPVFARMIFGLVNLAARRGLAGGDGAEKQVTRETGIRGETFAYWYLRRHGYIIVARNFTVPGMHGELDLVARDGDVLAFVEVKLRAFEPQPDSTSRDAASPGEQATRTGPAAGAVAKLRRALPEDAITRAKRHHLSRIAKQFLLQWRLRDTKYRFDVLAIETAAGSKPIVRLHKDAFVADA
jgi:Holliday junction resolvase-like predicted endonuclease